MKTHTLIQSVVLHCLQQMAQMLIVTALLAGAQCVAAFAPSSTFTRTVAGVRSAAKPATARTALHMAAPKVSRQVWHLNYFDHAACYCFTCSDDPGSQGTSKTALWATCRNMKKCLTPMANKFSPCMSISLRHAACLCLGVLFLRHYDEQCADCDHWRRLSVSSRVGSR